VCLGIAEIAKGRGPGEFGAAQEDDSQRSAPPRPCRHPALPVVPLARGRQRRAKRRTVGGAGGGDPAGAEGAAATTARAPGRPFLRSGFQAMGEEAPWAVAVAVEVDASTAGGSATRPRPVVASHWTNFSLSPCLIAEICL